MSSEPESKHTLNIHAEVGFCTCIAYSMSFVRKFGFGISLCMLHFRLWWPCKNMSLTNFDDRQTKKYLSNKARHNKIRSLKEKLNRALIWRWANVACLRPQRITFYIKRWIKSFNGKSWCLILICLKYAPTLFETIFTFLQTIIVISQYCTNYIIMHQK